MLVAVLDPDELEIEGGGLGVREDGVVEGDGVAAGGDDWLDNLHEAAGEGGGDAPLPGESSEVNAAASAHYLYYVKLQRGKSGEETLYEHPADHRCY